MHVTDRQVRKLLMEYQKSGEVGMAALKAGMHRETAGKYLSGGLLPSQQRVDRDWLTRPNPFEGHWAEVAAMLADAPELEGKALFEWVCEQYPGVYHEGQAKANGVQVVVNAVRVDRRIVRAGHGEGFG